MNLELKDITKKLNELKIQSKRISLEKFGDDEVEFNVQHELQPDLMRYIKEIESEKKIREKTIECAQPWKAEEGKWLLVSLRLIENNDYIGLLCLRYTSIEDRLVEIGWRLATQFHGKGYASEAASAFIDFIGNDLNINKAMALIDSENKSSIKLALKLKMKKEAHFFKHFQLNNQWRDEVIYSHIF